MRINRYSSIIIIELTILVPIETFTEANSFINYSRYRLRTNSQIQYTNTRVATKCSSHSIAILTSDTISVTISISPSISFAITYSHRSYVFNNITSLYIKLKWHCQNIITTSFDSQCHCMSSSIASQSIINIRPCDSSYVSNSISIFSIVISLNCCNRSIHLRFFALFQYWDSIDSCQYSLSHQLRSYDWSDFEMIYSISRNTHNSSCPSPC